MVGVECHAPTQFRSDCQLAPRHDTPTSEAEAGAGAEAETPAI